jgi:hypothetical protein
LKRKKISVNSLRIGDLIKGAPPWDAPAEATGGNYAHQGTVEVDQDMMSHRGKDSNLMRLHRVVAAFFAAAKVDVRNEPQR